jgi:hypothetical protein
VVAARLVIQVGRWGKVADRRAPHRHKEDDRCYRPAPKALTNLGPKWESVGCPGIHIVVVGCCWAHIWAVRRPCGPK